MKLNFVVNEWIKDKIIAFKMASGTGVKSYEQEWTLELIPAGTKFTFYEKVELPFGIIGKLIGKLMSGISERHVKKMLRTLKRTAIA